MTYDYPGGGALDYFPCRYGKSRLVLRGPRRKLQGDYVAFLGGTETYGRFLPTPYPALFEHETGLKAVNLGCVNAGPDVYLRDRTLLEICRRARVTVIQVMGAQSLSNDCYTVHPRRNDRFLEASPFLKSLYPQIDFTEFHFTRHLLATLEQACAESFAMVRKELKQTWVARMQKLIERVDGPVVLLWLADRPPQSADRDGSLGTDPLFVDRRMLAKVGEGVAQTLEIVASEDEIRDGAKDLVHGPLDQPAAEEVLGPVVHQRAALALAEAVPALI